MRSGVLMGGSLGASGHARRRVDDDERPPQRIKLGGRRRHDFHEAVIDRTIKCPAVDEELDLVVESTCGAVSARCSRYWLPRRRITTQNSTLRCVASTMYSMAGGPVLRIGTLILTLSGASQSNSQR